MSLSVTEATLTIGSVLAGYRLERKLGEGGMGAVYLARNPDLPRYDAVKVLSGELSADPVFRARFIREADVAARLSHPNIVAVYGRGETEAGQLWIAMQFVDGTDADAALRAGDMSPQRAVRITGEVAAALDYAHAHHVVHRDIKPANFLVCRDGAEERVLLADFGIARALDDVGLTATGAVMSTVAYAAPEVLAGTHFDYRADLYSLGCSLFRLLTGKTPFWAEAGVSAVMLAHLEQPPPRVTDLAPQLPPALNDVIAIALAKDPAQRFHTAGDLAAAAAGALAGHAPTVRAAAGTAPWYPPGYAPQALPASARPKRRRRMLLALLGIGLLVAATVSVLSMTRAHPETAGKAAAAAPAPTVPMRNLPALLPTADALGAVLGTPVTIEPINNAIGADSESTDSQDCAGPWAAAQRAAYAGSGWQALALQSADQSQPAALPGGLPPAPVNSIIGVLSFPTAELASRFLDGQKPRWQDCAGRTITFTGQDNMRMPDRFDTFAVTGDNVLTISHQMPNLQYSCGRALTVRNNIAIDVAVCNSAKPTDAAVSLAEQIAAKVPY
jgi:serine/threonine-protein kinase